MPCVPSCRIPATDLCLRSVAIQHLKTGELQVKRETLIEASELARDFALQPILQRGFRGVGCTVMHGALLASTPIVGKEFPVVPYAELHYSLQ